MGKFEPKIEVITGSSSGIGLAIAKRFVKSSLYHPDCVDCGNPISPGLCLVAAKVQAAAYASLDYSLIFLAKKERML